MGYQLSAVYNAFDSISRSECLCPYCEGDLEYEFDGSQLSVKLGVEAREYGYVRADRCVELADWYVWEEGCDGTERAYDDELVDQGEVDTDWGSFEADDAETDRGQVCPYCGRSDIEPLLRIWPEGYDAYVQLTADGGWSVVSDASDDDKDAVTKLMRQATSWEARSSPRTGEGEPDPSTGVTLDAKTQLENELAELQRRIEALT